MKSYDFEAVVFDGEVYCTGCFVPFGREHQRVTINCPEVSPIFADSEWDYYPVCFTCGEEHTYVSLTSDGRRDRMLRLAARHNMEVWSDRVTEVTCACGCYDLPHDAVHSDARVYCPSCEDEIPADGIKDTDRVAFWFWCCSPGCMPEGPPDGPYDTAIEALEAATEGCES
jgi:hypothetical protein